MPLGAILICRVREGQAGANNHKQLLHQNLIKLLMTCHSKARQMFIDAQYQLHSSSVRVRTLAAIAPTTPTHLALPPHNIRKTALRLLRVDVELSPCPFTQSEERAAGCLFIYQFFILTVLLVWPHWNTSATFPEPLPRLLPHLRCGSSHFLVVTLSAFTLTRDTHDKLGVEVKVMGCESNAPAPTIHTVCSHIHTHGQNQTHKCRNITCVQTTSHTTTLGTRPLSETKNMGSVANRVMTWMYITDGKENRKWKFGVPSNQTQT